MGEQQVIARVRMLCLALPEAVERPMEHHTSPSFRIRDKIFTMVEQDHHGSGRLAVWVKAPPGVQEILIHSDPERFFRPPYVGPRGWVGVMLADDGDWDELRGLVEDSYRLIAPKRLAAALASAGSGTQPDPVR